MYKDISKSQFQHYFSVVIIFIVECRQRHRGPVVMVTQAAGGAQRLHHDMPVLSDFPCCDIPGRSADGKYPPLQWQQRAAKVAVHRAAAHGSWLQVHLTKTKNYLPDQYSTL